MKNYIKDYIINYKDLLVHTGKFCKKHWAGIAVTNVAVCAAELLYFRYKIDKTFKYTVSDFSNDKESE